MMHENLFLHIEFLLSRHNCIVVPRLGAFVISEPLELNIQGSSVKVPKYAIAFNPELNHDDGALISFYSQTHKMSYKAASIAIKKLVADIQATLISDSVKCGRLGQLDVNENGCLIFSANKKYTHPKFFGLKSVQMERLLEISNSENKAKISTHIKYMIGATAAAVAAIMLFIAPTSTVKELGTNLSQQASFVQSISDMSEEKQIPSPIIEEAPSLNADSSNSITPSEPAISATRSYYIIVGGDTSRARAKKALVQIQAKSFPDANIVESSDRFRIYAASFEDKKEAERYLVDLRIEHPEHTGAWLYSKKN